MSTPTQANSKRLLTNADLQSGFTLPVIQRVDVSAKHKNAGLVSNAPATTGDYQICGYVNVTSYGTGSVTLVVTYLDENNNAVTDDVLLNLKATTTMTTGANTASQYKGLAFGLRASGGHTIAVTATTAASSIITYDAGSWLLGVS